MDTSDLPAVACAVSSTELEPDCVERTLALANNQHAPQTRQAYRTDWNAFATWCATHNLPAVPIRAEIVAVYLGELVAAGKAYATIQRRVSGLSTVAKRTPDSDDIAKHSLIRAVLRGIRRQIGTAQKVARALSAAEMRQLVAVCPTTLGGRRDRALLLTAYFGAFRRSEVVDLCVAHIGFTHEGMTVLLPTSKTDQEGQGLTKGLPYRNDALCPVGAMQVWLEHRSGSSTDPIFVSITKGGKLGARLSARGVGLILLRRARAAKLNTDGLSAHSLRAGFATSVAAAGGSLSDIARQTGHKSFAQVARYVREGRLFVNNPAAMIE
jgi:site-specific recombinase XerD